MKLLHRRKTKTNIAREGEKHAAGFLKRQGYHILERNCRTRLGELDIVALDGDVVSFVEVKSRKSEFLPPEASVTLAKRRQIIRLAKAYLVSKSLTSYPCRFDIVSVVFTADKPTCELIKNAFLADGR